VNAAPLAIAWIVFACVFGGAMLGLFLRPVLPKHHLSADSRDVVKLAIALIATMSALVLSLLIASAKSSYDTRSSEFTQMSADIILLDRVLAHYGPETTDIRSLLRHSVTAMLDRMSAADGDRLERLGPWGANAAVLYDKIEELLPQSEAQRSVQSQSLRMIMELGHTRWLLFAQSGSTIPMPFLVVLVFWLAIIFASFGLFAPRNLTVISTFVLCALSVSGAIFLILELDRSFEGLLQISNAPLQEALSQLGQ
jgi:hypothetical protein